jgi:DNA repair protein RecO (recombination protein O)
MADIRKTEALILTTMRFRETSLITSALTKYDGKIKLVAKGARRPRSKFCGALEPFCLDTVIFYKKEDRDLYTLSDAVVIESFDKIRRSARKSHGALVICELLDRTQPAGEGDEWIFGLAVSCLHMLNDSHESDTRHVLYRFLLKSLDLLGVKPTLESCMRCHAPIPPPQKYNFSVAAGGLVCDKDFDDSVVSLQPETVNAMKALYRGAVTALSDDSLGDIQRLLPLYFYYHLGGLRLNSLKYVK